MPSAHGAWAGEAHANGKGSVMASKTCLRDPLAPSAKFALVVDDEPLMRQTSAALLTEAGFLVITADDGDEAVKTAPMFPFSVIVTDLEMPRLHGLDAVRRIRDLGGSLATVPVILYSGTAYPPGEDERSAAGADAFVAKGGGSSLLLRTIDSLIRDKNLRDGWCDGSLNGPAHAD